jgi:hypothetical protein
VLVFIDESGDAGFKVAKGSSPLFVAAMVIFVDQEKAQRDMCVGAVARSYRNDRSDPNRWRAMIEDLWEFE